MNSKKYKKYSEKQDYEEYFKVETRIKNKNEEEKIMKEKRVTRSSGKIN